MKEMEEACIVVVVFLRFIYLLNLFCFGCAGLCCCTWTFSSCSGQGLRFTAVQGLLIAVASLVAEHRL